MEWIKIDNNNKPEKHGVYMCFVPDCKHYNKHWDEYYWDGERFIDTQPLVGNNREVQVTHYMIIQEPK